MDLNRSRPDLIVPTILPGDRDWRQNVMSLISINKSTLSSVILPIKQNFPDDKSWRKWAYLFIQSASNT